MITVDELLEIVETCGSDAVAVDTSVIKKLLLVVLSAAHLLEDMDSEQQTLSHESYPSVEKLRKALGDL